MFVVETNQTVKDEGERGLEWTVVGERGNGNNEEVEEKAERGETDSDAGGNLVDEEKVFGDGIADEEESGLEQEGQRFHDEIEVPGSHSVHLALSTPTAVNDRSTRLHLGIMVEPLPAQRGEECGEEGNAQTCVKDGQGIGSHGTGASPLRENGSRTGWGMPKRDVGDNLKEAIAQLCVIRLETTLKVDNEKGCNYGEQTGLFVRKTRQRRDQGECGKSTHKDQRGVQVLFVSTHKVAVMLFGCALELVVEFSVSAISRSMEVWEKRWQGFEHCIFQTGNKKYGRQRPEHKGRGSMDARTLLG